MYSSQVIMFLERNLENRKFSKRKGKSNATYKIRKWKISKRIRRVKTDELFIFSKFAFVNVHTCEP